MTSPETTSSRPEAVLLWFRHDLRLADNLALHAAVAADLPIVPVFVWAPEEEAPQPGAASRWWLHQSLVRLDESLRTKGSQLIVRHGPTAKSLLALAAEVNARRIFCNRVYEPASLARDPDLERTLKSSGIVTETFNASLLFEAASVRTTTGGPFHVFTPFWRACWNERGAIRRPTGTPAAIARPRQWPHTLPLADLGLEPKIDWAAGIRAAWTPGEDGARSRLRAFAKGPVCRYAKDRDRTDEDGTSRLSPHLHFGEISPVQMWHAVAAQPAAEPWLRQLVWREFAHYLLVERPDTLSKPFYPQFRQFPWHKNAGWLKAWQHGRTGYPLVDAAMRQLWSIGWMHNRARLIVASFLVKHLLIPWQEGAAWFLDTLVDADLANNTMGWQWVAGCGVDAAPYFRIFNPVLQGDKFDPEGNYVRQWVAELRKLPARWIHQPWEAPPLVLAAANVHLGDNYPRPLVDHAEARAAALAAFEQMKQAERKG